MAIHNDVGKIGEEISVEFLRDKGLQIVERNFRRSYGEIDIVARETGGMLVFIEVKTVSWETGRSVPYETHRPEDNVHPQKLRRLANAIQAYLLRHEDENDWRFDVMAVYLDTSSKTAKIRHIKDVVIG